MSTEQITDAHLLERIVWDDADGYETVQSEITGQSRWRTDMETVFKRLSDGKLFITYWARGSTENCDHDFPDVATEAIAENQTITVYRVYKGDL